MEQIISFPKLLLDSLLSQQQKGIQKIPQTGSGWISPLPLDPRYVLGEVQMETDHKGRLTRIFGLFACLFEFIYFIFYV